LKLFTFLFAFIIVSAAALVAYYSLYPDVSNLKRRNPHKTAFMEYRQQEWQRKGKKVRLQQKWVAFSQISPFAAKAIIIAEDDKFWSHHGFDLDGIEKALDKDLKEGRFKAGGSTISQQLAKNLYLSPSKNPLRKLAEALITYRMERTLSKRRILELYMNVAEWGEGIFGIEAASLHYYGKPASAITPEEAAQLAAVLPNPRRYVANGNSRFVKRRASLIYNIMVKRRIVVKDYEDAASEPDQSPVEVEEEAQ
jgi:monofunctional glycosyltransferase